MPDINKLAQEYAELDAQFTALKKEHDVKKAILKKAMIEGDVNSIINPNKSKVSCLPVTKTDFDMELALTVMEEEWKKLYGDAPCPYIKTVRMIDAEKVESALYDKEMDTEIAEKLGECLVVTTTYAIKCNFKKMEV